MPQSFREDQDLPMSMRGRIPDVGVTHTEDVEKVAPSLFGSCSSNGSMADAVSILAGFTGAAAAVKIQRPRTKRLQIQAHFSKHAEGAECAQRAQMDAECAECAECAQNCAECAERAEGA